MGFILRDRLKAKYINVLKSFIIAFKPLKFSKFLKSLIVMLFFFETSLFSYAHIFFFETCLFRRNIIEAVYSRLNPHRENEGVSVYFDCYTCLLIRISR